MRSLLILIGVLMIQNIYASEIPFKPYIIKKGDVLSSILKNHELAPLYGKEKWVNKVLKLNRLTEESTKKLEPNDVIIIPKASFVFETASFKKNYISIDEVKTLRSSIKKEIQNSRLKPKRHNYNIQAGYFINDINFKNSSTAVNVNQNLQLTGKYKDRIIQTNNTYSFNKEVSATFFTQSNASFDDDDSRIAEFTPSGKISLGIEIENRVNNFSLTPTYSAEYASVLTKDELNYDVEKKVFTWAGLKATKYFAILDFKSYITIEGYLDSKNNGDQVSLSAGTIIKNQYNIEFYNRITNFTVYEETQIKSIGINLGYLF